MNLKRFPSTRRYLHIVTDRCFHGGLDGIQCCLRYASELVKLSIGGQLQMAASNFGSVNDRIVLIHSINISNPILPLGHKRATFGPSFPRVRFLLDTFLTP